MEQSSGKASTRAKNKYRDKTYDRVEITLPKGRKAELQVHAEQRAESLNAFIERAIQETIERDAQEATGKHVMRCIGGEMPSDAAGATEAASTCSLLHDHAKMAHSASEATGETTKEVK